MIDRQHGAIIFECDGCGESLNTECHDFNEALYSLRTHDWKAKKEAGAIWCHYCPGCK
jgi:hypothetical protein